MIELATPLGLLALLSLPLILALYSLRPTRRRVEVGSTLLWREALRERRRGLGLEKLLRNLGLLLLLLFALLLSLGLAAPEWLATASDRGDVVLVVDTSASMQAEADGTTRFELARREAAALIGELSDDSRLLLMTSGRHAVLRSPFSADRRDLLDRLDALAPGDEAGRPREALALALSLLRHRERARVVFVTDGAFDAAPAFGNVDVEYRLVGSARDNVAITRFDARREIGSEDRFQVLVGMRSHAAETVEVPLSVTLEGQTLVEEQVSLAPGEQRTLVWPFRGRAAGRVMATLGVDDGLDADDRAYAVLGSDEPLRVLLLSAGSPYLQSVLAALPNVSVTRLPEVPPDLLAAEAGRHDVVVVDRLPLPSLPPGAWLLVESVPPGLPFHADGRVARPVVTGLGRSALLERLDAGALDIEEAVRVVLDDGAAGLQPLFWSEAGPLALAGIVDGRRVVHLAFDPARSNLPLQAAFPLFMRQVVEWLRPRLRRDSPTQFAAGETVALPVPPRFAEVVLRGPEGEASVLPAENGLLRHEQTSRAGFYQVSFGYDAGAVQRWFAVNLADESESDLRPRAAVGDTGRTTAAIDTSGRVAEPLWPWLVALALLALLAEWCLGLRRPRRA